MEVEKGNFPFQFAEIVEPNMQILPFSEKSNDGLTHSLICHIPDAKSLNANLLIEGKSDFELYISNPDKTIEYASEALQLSLEFEDKSQEGLALINLCQSYLFNDLYDKAL